MSSTALKVIGWIGVVLFTPVGLICGIVLKRRGEGGGVMIGVSSVFIILGLVIVLASGGGSTSTEVADEPVQAQAQSQVEEPQAEEPAPAPEPDPAPAPEPAFGDNDRALSLMEESIEVNLRIVELSEEGTAALNAGNFAKACEVVAEMGSEITRNGEILDELKTLDQNVASDAELAELQEVQDLQETNQETLTAQC